jgi:hypothetical protein
MQFQHALRRQHEPLDPAGRGAGEAGEGERVPGRPALRPETLLAVRVAHHHLATQLELAVGYLEILVNDPDLPVHLREAARTALGGAELAVQMLEVAQQHLARDTSSTSP